MTSVATCIYLGYLNNFTFSDDNDLFSSRPVYVHRRGRKPLSSGAALRIKKSLHSQSEKNHAGSSKTQRDAHVPTPNTKYMTLSLGIPRCVHTLSEGFNRPDRHLFYALCIWPSLSIVEIRVDAV